jgi:hypothetical protein
MSLGGSEPRIPPFQLVQALYPTFRHRSCDPSRRVRKSVLQGFICADTSGRNNLHVGHAARTGVPRLSVTLRPGRTGSGTARTGRRDRRRERGRIRQVDAWRSSHPRAVDMRCRRGSETTGRSSEDRNPLQTPAPLRARCSPWGRLRTCERLIEIDSELDRARVSVNRRHGV